MQSCLSLPMPASTTSPPHTSCHQHAVSDDELMVRAASGDRRAFDDLVRRHRARVFAHARRFLAEDALAHDASQNTFLALFCCVHRYRSQGRFRAYLRKLTSNQCRMLLRARREVPTAWQTDAVSSTALAVRSSHDASVCVRQVLAHLSEPLRAVVALRYGWQLTTAETASTLGIPEGTVKRRLFDARRVLHKG